MKFKRSENSKSLGRAVIVFVLALLYGFLFQRNLNAQDFDIENREVEGVDKESGAEERKGENPEGADDSKVKRPEQENEEKPTPPRPELSLQERERELFAEIEKLRWKIAANSKALKSLKEKRAEEEIPEEEMIVHMERERALAARLRLDSERYLKLKEQHAKLVKQIQAKSGVEEDQGPASTVIEADIIDGPRIEQKKQVLGSAASLFDTINTSSPMEGDVSEELFKSTVKEISEEQ